MPHPTPSSVTASADVLSPLARELGGILVERVPVEGPRGLELVDVVVDRFGLVMVITIEADGSMVTGCLADETWTALGAQSATTFENPFKTHERLALPLVQSLAAPVVLDVSHVSLLVAFAGADTTLLDVPDPQSFRITTVAGLAEAYHARHDFAVNAGVLDAQGIAAAVAQFEAIARRVPASAPVVSSAPQLSPQPSAPMPAVPVPWAPVDAPWDSTTHQGFSAPASSAAPYRPMTSPTGAGPLPGISLSTADIPRRSHRLRVNVSLIAALAVSGFAVWLMYYGGIHHVVGSLSGSVAGLQGRYTSEIQSESGLAGSADLALSALQDTEPAVYARLVDAAHPSAFAEGEYSIYRWEYRPDGSTGTKTVRVVFDDGGVVRGVQVQH